MNIKGKTISVLGAGVSGRAAARLALRQGARVFLCDQNKSEAFVDKGAELQRLGIECCFGGRACPETSDLVVISPGIEADSDFVKFYNEASNPVIGEIEFASRFWNGAMVGITGTNGKTTCTKLCTHLFNACGSNAVAGGNYGKSFSEIVLESRDSETRVILELSSFQLETIDTFHPSTTVWLNFAPDHLDRYSSLEEYFRAKSELYRNEMPSDWAIVNALNGPERTLQSKTLTFSSWTKEADFILDDDRIVYQGEEVCKLSETRLNGAHNAENLMAALAVGWCEGLSLGEMRDALPDFEPPRHRCEVVMEDSDLTFVNDSKATNLHALESSLRAQTRPVYLIAGGKEKGLTYDELKDLFKEKVKGASFIGEIRNSLQTLFAELAPCQMAVDLDEAVLQARKQAPPGSVVLFSPGTSSFDMFKGYEDRGDAFCQSVKHLTLKNV